MSGNEAEVLKYHSSQNVVKKLFKLVKINDLKFKHYCLCEFQKLDEFSINFIDRNLENGYCSSCSSSHPDA